LSVAHWTSSSHPHFYSLSLQAYGVAVQGSILSNDTAEATKNVLLFVSALTAGLALQRRQHPTQLRFRGLGVVDLEIPLKGTYRCLSWRTPLIQLEYLATNWACKSTDDITVVGGFSPTPVLDASCRRARRNHGIKAPERQRYHVPPVRWRCA
jgi:hypothetical protein